MNIEPMYVHVIVGVLLPILVGLVTKAEAPAKVKIVVNMVLSAAGALVVNSVNDLGVAVISWEMFAAWLMQTVVAVASYVGVYKPLDFDAKAAPTRGVG